MQIAEYQPGGTHRILKHVGSAHSAVELGVLVARAYELRQRPSLDLEAPAVVVPMAADPAPAAGPAQPALVAAVTTLVVVVVEHLGVGRVLDQ